MKKFNILIEETLQRIVEVEAATSEEAESKVQQMYDDSEIVLDSGDYVDTEIHELKEVEDA